MAIRINRRLFEAPISDEVSLAASAREHLPGLSSPPTTSQILALCTQASTDIAARVFYEGILASSLHGQFINTLNTFPNDNVAHQNAKVKLIALPGMFYREHPEVGADGRLACEIARHFGFETKIVPLESTGSVSRNSEILRATLTDETESELWLLSMSKGSSEARHYLQHHPYPPNLKGWINVAGILRGVPMVDRKLATPLRRAVSRLLCALFSVDYNALREMHIRHHFWQKNIWPTQMDIIHIVPVPLASHIQGKLRPRHQQLLPLGPNDGLVPVTDVLGLPGRIYPIWGSDHFLRTPKLSALLYQLFNYIAYTSHGAQHETPTANDHRLERIIHLSKLLG